MKITTVPFSGFYYSIHDTEIDDTITQMFSDRDSGMYPNVGLESALFYTCNFHKVHIAYAAEYCKNFASEYEIASLKFESLNSPKEYNFTTDRIFAHISLTDCRSILARVNQMELENQIKSKFTSRDGFISFYSNNLHDWGHIETWDHNQIGTLLECFVGSDFDQYAEFNLMESDRCNGRINEWIESASPNISRLYKIHDYLETRAQRGTA